METSELRSEKEWKLEMEMGELGLGFETEDDIKKDFLNA